MSEESLNVGIDVSKDTLDIAISNGERWRCANDEGGIAELIERLRRWPPERIVLEATGGYERPPVAALHRRTAGDGG